MASQKPGDSRPRIPNVEEMLQMVEGATNLQPEEKVKLREEVLRTMTEPIPVLQQPDITDSKAWEILIVAFLLFLIASSIGKECIYTPSKSHRHL